MRTRPQQPAQPPAHSLAAAYGAVLFDCDGVLYVGDHAVPAAPAALARLRALGRGLAFVTNNSSVAPAKVAARLTRLGITAHPGEVTTSAQATVALLGGADKLTGTHVLVVGGDGLRAALTDAGAHVLPPDADWRTASTVVVGFTRDLTYEDLRRATLAVGAGARFVGTNPDLTLPTPEGAQPGAGATLALLAAATGRTPEIAGKPHAPMLTTAAHAAGAGPYLMVGDRSDTDLDGATRLGWDTALVLTGITRPAELLDLPHPPTYVLHDVGGLAAPPPPPIRPATPAEQPRLRQLLPTPDRPDGSLVAGGRSPAGTVAWTLQGTRATIHGPAVTPHARGQLTGTRLLLTAAAHLRAAGATHLTIPADPQAKGFFTRLGFQPDPADPGRLTRTVPPPPADPGPELTARAELDQ